MKDAVVDLATEDSFIETALSDDTLKTTLVNELVLDNDFVAILLNTTEFKEYVIDQLRNSTLGQDVKNLINTLQNVMKFGHRFSRKLKITKIRLLMSMRTAHLQTSKLKI